MDQWDSVVVKLDLWVLKYEFHMDIMCHEILSDFFQSFENVKTIFSLQTVL